MSHLVTARQLLEGDGRAVDRPAFPFDLGLRGVQEIVPDGYGDGPAALGFALAASPLKARKGILLWVRGPRARHQYGKISAQGMKAFGIDPGRVLCVEPGHEVETLWCIEEAIKSAAVAGVLAEIEDAGFTAGRRLVLASAHTGVPVSLVFADGRDSATASLARWRVTSQASGRDHHDVRAPGRARWQVVLERARHVPEATGQTFDVEHDHATLSLHLVSGLADRPAAPRTPERTGAPVWRRAG